MTAEKFLITLAALFFATNAVAEEGDPCDFVSGSTRTFRWHRVMDCYKSVPFVRSDLEQIVGVLQENREFSDLSELYDERYGWKENLNALLRRNFQNDFEMHEALGDEHIAMQNPHINYFGPACYYDLLVAFIPFDFGSTIWPKNEAAGRGGNQIIFIEGAPFSPGLYRRHTGIEPEEYVGAKVLKIDNVPALKFFREYGRDRVSVGSFDSSNLMNIINRRQMFSLRGSPLSSLQPRKPSVEMKLKKRDGELIKVEFPWVYGDRRALGLGRGIPLTKSTEEFHALCLQRPGAENAGPTGVSAMKNVPFPFGIDEDHEFMNRKMRDYKMKKIERAKSAKGSFYEVPPDELDKDIRFIARLEANAWGFQYKDDTTVLRLFNTLPFYRTARATIDHACENSSRLIIDVRSNSGGLDDPILWLYRHLIDDGGARLEQSGKVAFRVRQDPEIWNRFLDFSSIFGFLSVEELGALPFACEFFAEQQCWQDLEADQQGLIPYTEIGWFEDPSVTEVRAGTPIPLTRKVGLGESLHFTIFGSLPPRDVSACQDKFSGENLIILTDGANCSGGYFLLEPFIENNTATVVTMGGYVADPDDEIEVGICRTGPTFFVDTARQVVDEVEGLSEGALTMERPIPSKFARAVSSLMESNAAYRGQTDELHWDAPLTYDIRLNVWSDSPETDGYVYGEVIQAVEDYMGE